MALPKIEIKLTNPTEATIEVAGKAIGTVKVRLQEQETIAGVDNAIVVLGDCENLQNGSVSGFVFQYQPNIITAPKPVSELPTIAPKGV